jgi:four helix bundle protein
MAFSAGILVDPATGVAMGDYRRLLVWKRSHALTLTIYQLTQTLPKGELYGLVAQLRRSAASIPANIAEGCGRNMPGDMTRFLRIALGSANETDYWVTLARDLGYIHPTRADTLGGELSHIRRMLTRLIWRVTDSR